MIYYALKLLALLMCVLHCRVRMGYRLAIGWLYRDAKYFMPNIGKTVSGAR